jgi:hypothetical protein
MEICSGDGCDRALVADGTEHNLANRLIGILHGCLETRQRSTYSNWMMPVSVRCLTALPPVGGTCT